MPSMTPSEPEAQGRLRRRARTVTILTGVALLGLSMSFGWELSHSHVTSVLPVRPQRGRIVMADGTALATTLGAQRRYPQAQLAGALTGFAGTDGAGLEGVERAWDDVLRVGGDVRLTIEPTAQRAAEAALTQAVRDEEAQWGAAVVLDTRTGRVLALAGAPAFDPGAWPSRPPTAWRLRPVLETYEPGSVIKALTVASLLNERRTTRARMHDAPMRRAVGGASIGDAVPHPARLSTQGILRYSSNVGMTHLVEGLTATELSGYFRRFGLGQPAPLGPLPSPAGVLGDPAAWGVLGRATRAFGQGLTVNTVQLAAAFNVIANDGRYVPPQLFEPAMPAAPTAVLRPAVAREMRAMLHAVVDDALKGRAVAPGYHAGGKTGTAQVAARGGYSPDVFTSTFAGFFPAERPRVTIAVAVRGARRHYQGSQLAAPLFQTITSELAASWALPPEVEARPAAPPP